MEKVGIIGVGMHRFGKFPALSLTEMGLEACVQALVDSGLEKKRIALDIAKQHKGFVSMEITISFIKLIYFII